MNSTSVKSTPVIPVVYILMGVSATGKTTLGNALADATGGTFYDGDDYHPEENRLKMSRGEALNDDDRKPWLEILADLITERAKVKETPTFIACSALKKSYRDILRSGDPGLMFLHLHADPEILKKRIAERYEAGEHFMPPSLLDSQLETLEIPKDALPLNVSESPENLVTQFLDWRNNFT